MNIFINLLLIFVFLYGLFNLRVPNLTNNNFILNKFIIFISLVCFQFIIIIIQKIKNNCKIDINEVLNNSINIGLFGIIGYSLYNDLIWMYNLNISTKRMYLYVTLIIILFIAFVKFLKILFVNNYQDCVKYD